MGHEEETVPDIIGQLQPYQRWARSRLEQELGTGPKTLEDARRQLHARLALVAEDDRHVDQIKDALLNAETSYIGVLRDALLPHAPRLVRDFRQDLRNSELPAEHRFRAGLFGLRARFFAARHEQAEGQENGSDDAHAER